MLKPAFKSTIKVVLFSLVFALVAALFGLLSFLTETKSEVKRAMSSTPKQITLIIDAGHGGRDGGAEGSSGKLEKVLNLEISNKLYTLFSLVDIECIMTRTEDVMLYKEGQESRKKLYDLKNRIEIAEKYENSVLLSIHQNKFPNQKYKGLQVYYSENHPESKIIADLVQSKTKACLQNDNTRKTKAAGKNIYLLRNINCPAVIIECGFLSNSEDETNLNDEEYQKKLAFVMFSSIMDYISNNKGL